MKSIKFGEHLVPLWLIITLLVSGIGVAVLTDYVWKTITMPFEVEEPLEVLSYPSELSLYPGITKEFNVTVMNYASRNYTVLLDFCLDNTTYQESYVTFSDETYTIVPDEQNLTAWLKVEEYAPPISSSLTIDFHRIAGKEKVLFFDNFDDGVADGWTVQLGNFEVINGEYYTENELSEKSITTVDDLTCTDCIIEVNLRFSGTEAGFRSGIVFRYTDNAHHYVLYVSAETTVAEFCMFTPQDTHWGHTIDGVLNRSVVINYHTDYLLRACIQGDTFTGFLNGEKILSVTDGNYTSGQVGLRAQRSDIYFDNFTVYSLP